MNTLKTKPTTKQDSYIPKDISVSKQLVRQEKMQKTIPAEEFFNYNEYPFYIYNDGKKNNKFINETDYSKSDEIIKTTEKSNSKQKKTMDEKNMDKNHNLQKCTNSAEERKPVFITKIVDGSTRVLGVRAQKFNNELFSKVLKIQLASIIFFSFSIVLFAVLILYTSVLSIATIFDLSALNFMQSDKVGFMMSILSYLTILFMIISLILLKIKNVKYLRNFIFTAYSIRELRVLKMKSRTPKNPSGKKNPTALFSQKSFLATFILLCLFVAVLAACLCLTFIPDESLLPLSTILIPMYPSLGNVKNYIPVDGISFTLILINVLIIFILIWNVEKSSRTRKAFKEAKAYKLV